MKFLRSAAGSSPPRAGKTGSGERGGAGGGASAKAPAPQPGGALQAAQKWVRASVLVASLLPAGLGAVGVREGRGRGGGRGGPLR